jgi:hypothetical protein
VQNWRIETVPHDNDEIGKLGKHDHRPFIQEQFFAVQGLARLFRTRQRVAKCLARPPTPRRGSRHSLQLDRVNASRCGSSIQRLRLARDYLSGPHQSLISRRRMSCDVLGSFAHIASPAQRMLTRGRSPMECIWALPIADVIYKLRWPYRRSFESENEAVLMLCQRTRPCK